MGDWQPIETASKGCHLLLWSQNDFEATGGVFIGIFIRGEAPYGRGWIEHDSGIEYMPTKWMPLTALPTPPVVG